jgi:endonuclease YncB( thermonuclease family)
MRRAVAIVAVVAAVAGCSAGDDAAVGTGEEVGRTVDVERVVDGDSLLVGIDGDRVEVRLAGINAPEAGECRGAEATTALAGYLADATVRIAATGGADTDQFGRLVRYVYADDVLVNAEMLTAGHATVLQVDHRRRAEFAAHSDEAYRAGRGMWAPAACDDAATEGIRIRDVVFDAPGPDAANPSGEFVVIANTGAVARDLGGWIIRDESSQHRYRFPDGYRLAPGATVALSSGCEPPAAGGLAWCAAGAVWSNDGDTVILQTPAGTVVDRVRFEG